MTCREPHTKHPKKMTELNLFCQEASAKTLWSTTAGSAGWGVILSRKLSINFNLRFERSFNRDVNDPSNSSRSSSASSFIWLFQDQSVSVSLYKDYSGSFIYCKSLLPVLVQSSRELVSLTHKTQYQVYFKTGEHCIVTRFSMSLLLLKVLVLSVGSLFETLSFFGFAWIPGYLFCIEEHIAKYRGTAFPSVIFSSRQMMVLAAESCNSHVMFGTLISEFTMLFSPVWIASHATCY